MGVVCDTDILSVFAKVGRLDLLEKVFPDKKLLISESVYDELMVSREKGFGFPERIFDHCKIVGLRESEIEQYRKMKEKPKYFPLSKADLRTLILADSRELPVLSNDKHLLKLAEERKILALDTYDVLRIHLNEETLTGKEVEKVLTEMEEKDNAEFKDREKIFE